MTTTLPLVDGALLDGALFDGADVDDDEPRALSVWNAVDGYSGAFGVDVTFLLLGGASTLALTLVMSAILRRPSSAPGEPQDSP